MPIEPQIISLRNLLKNPKILTNAELGFAEMLNEICMSFERYQQVFDDNMIKLAYKMKEFDEHLIRTKKQRKK